MDFNKLSELLYPQVTESVADIMKRYPPRQINGEVTRFAPSPTGFLHIGHFFGAFIDYMIAKSTGGVFYFRLEDTDQKRIVEGSDKVALDMLARFGVEPTEGYFYGGEYGPYQQSKRVDIYNVFAKELVRRGRAVPCFCGENAGKAEIERRREETFVPRDPCLDLTFEQIKEKIDQHSPFALRLLSQGNVNNKTHYIDVIKGERDVSENDQNVILIKSNGIPVYAFAHLVDDTLMHTTIVVRGEEWYSSLPVHLELFKAMGLTPPKYAHTPVIMKTDETTGNKRKISKRQDPEADMRYFLQQGYPVEAVKEYLLTLLNSKFEPWRTANPTAPLDSYPFDTYNIGSNDPFFDMDKLNNISKRIISVMTAQQVYDNTLAHAKEYDPAFADELTHNADKWLSAFAIDRGIDNPRKDIYAYGMVKQYFHYLNDFEPTELDSTLAEHTTDSVTDANGTHTYATFLKDYIDSFTDYADNTEWFEDLKRLGSRNAFTDRKTYKANPNDYLGDYTVCATLLRYAITGSSQSPSLAEIMKIIGKEETKHRLSKMLELLKKSTL